MNTNNPIEIQVLIARNLAGCSDAFEDAQINSWIGASPDNRKYFEDLKNIWNSSEIIKDHERINTEEALGKIMMDILPVRIKKGFWFYWQRIAAILIFPFAVGILLMLYLDKKNSLFSNNLVYNEVHAAFGTRSKLILADSSLVWLNSGSSIKYPNKFNDKNRRILLSGEAYFEVKSNASKPFIVETSSLKIKSTGTKFNVCEYKPGSSAEVTLISGMVSVYKNGSSKNPEFVSDLKPDHHMILNCITKEVKLVKGDSYKYIAWKDGKLIFRNERLDKVLEKIGLMFNVDIELRDTDLKDYRYRATFQDESLEEILKLLKITAPINFIESERVPFSDGSFPRKKIIIYKINR